MHIAIISASVRTGRNSHRVALHLERSIKDNFDTVDLLDLNLFDFPIFNERLKHQKDPLPAADDFAARVRKADGVVIVTPEYNGGYPASLKNVVDLLTDEWKRKPVAISTVSDGSFGGTQVITSLLFSLWKIKALMVNAHLPVPKVHEAFQEDGTPNDTAAWAKRTTHFLDELRWVADLVRK